MKEYGDFTLIRFIYKLRKKISIVICSMINRMFFLFSGTKCGRRLCTNGILCISNAGGRVIIGDDVVMNSNSKANPIGGGDRIYFQLGENGEIKIGDRCKISNCAITAISQKVSIGEGTYIGAGVKIYSTDFHSVNPFDRMQNPEKLEYVQQGDIRIGCNSFIGACTIILKNVDIGDNSVIGAGSVVTSSIPSNEIWAGNPARFIRMLKPSELVKRE